MNPILTKTNAFFDYTNSPKKEQKEAFLEQLRTMLDCYTKPETVFEFVRNNFEGLASHQNSLSWLAGHVMEIDLPHSAQEVIVILAMIKAGLTTKQDLASLTDDHFKAAISELFPDSDQSCGDSNTIAVKIKRYCEGDNIKVRFSAGIELLEKEFPIFCLALGSSGYSPTNEKLMLLIEGGIQHGSFFHQNGVPLDVVKNIAKILQVINPTKFERIGEFFEILNSLDQKQKGNIFLHKRRIANLIVNGGFGDFGMRHFGLNRVINSCELRFTLEYDSEKNEMQIFQRTGGLPGDRGGLGFKENFTLLGSVPDLKFSDFEILKRV